MADLPEIPHDAETGDVEQTGVDGTYTIIDICTLKGLEAVRMKPGMYLGGTDERALHYCVFKVLENSIDEHMAGFGKKIEVVLNADGSISIRDEGRGIPVELHKDSGVPIVEMVLTTLHTGGKFNRGGYVYVGGTYGVGAKCVNAVSESFVVEISRDGLVYAIEFKRGETSKKLHTIGTSTQTGTLIRFKPDPLIFKETTEFKFDTIVTLLRQLAFLCPGLEVILQDERNESKTGVERFYYAHGLEEYVASVNQERNVINSKPVLISRVAEGVVLLYEKPYDIRIDIALQYNDSQSELISCFVNTIYNTDGGTHLVGFCAGMVRAINDYGKANLLFKDKDPSLIAEDVREGLVAVISLRHPQPRYESQHKAKLISSDVEGFVSSATYESLMTFFEANPESARKIVEKALFAASARKAAAKAKKAVRKTKEV